MARTVKQVVIALVTLLPLALPVMAQGQPQPPASGLATSDHEVSGVEVTLVELKRTSGDTITARWRYRNTTAEKKQLTKAYGGTDPWKLSLDSYLIDGANKKKYLLLTDSKGTPVAAKHGGSVEAIRIGPGETLSTWAKYPAPPSDVKKVSLYINGVAPFEDIAIAQ